jgi:hypothetical protein
MTRPAIYLELPLRQDWEAIGPLRDSLAARLMPVLGDPDQSRVLAMVASELLENAVKFGCWSERDCQGGKATLRIVAGGQAVSVTVTNPIDRERPGVLLLFERLRELETTRPAAAYQRRLRALMKDPEADPSGLGLVRMAYEAGCRLSAHVSAGGVLHVQALVPR